MPIFGTSVDLAMAMLPKEVSIFCIKNDFNFLSAKN
jgi:hypothetical protein